MSVLYHNRSLSIINAIVREKCREMIIRTQHLDKLEALYKFTWAVSNRFSLDKSWSKGPIAKVCGQIYVGNMTAVVIWRSVASMPFCSFPRDRRRSMAA